MTSSLKSNKTLFLILAAAFLMRLFVFISVNINNFDYSDVFSYIQVAKNIESGKGFTAEYDSGKSMEENVIHAII